ncbi:oxidoreductase (homolog to zinc-containing alcohol dehydrogenase / threonine 3-dehydrogenase) [Natrialba magadii ATCC 43099]|uniref:Alcohol dehydrogenase zinc-binding domain-containing protein n=1 Tax=Natrialba magadii (strain ATCC 43099 / DSM 3394 / CCM 3739 / CIP 104546 / IAM 13178 / JCM 8861 / NBRC 102185 / NCIMB 2190 / MS3) TaxID=547559 RepID=D3STX5_NATMM|nr:zinc-binding alcohol dehydrogenase [Natrialba magadii]ADD07064.1 oxidoreductase (homolog to zinc-containing alcohol dehydrogenase / threonine 3-dehydrogenase) [Natrialba magadii ATCC 43099]ELY28793.1 alcohol dehydrogenase zinc-binding domain-containing protein [Natrialba magadii ATCC 43099]
MTARTLSFTGPRTVEVCSRPIPDPGPTDVRVRTRVSAVSAGTEGLIYRGEAPADLPADSELDALEGDLSFPLTYGYAAVGEVDAVGSEVDDDWLGRAVFAYNAHESHFLATPDDLLPVPEEVTPREAALFANLETAVTFLLDGEPLVGEHVAVFGQGVVGLLTTALLARTPIETLVTFDPDGDRRQHADAFGADHTFDPTACAVEEAFADAATVAGTGDESPRADLSYELSGNPNALDDALAVTGFDGRLLVGSWYGDKPATANLGGRFHRDRIDIRSTQVSTIDPRLSGRWSRERRHELTWSWLRRLDLERLFTHEFPLEDAGTAYELLEERADGVVQVLFTYE